MSCTSRSDSRPPATKVSQGTASDGSSDSANACASSCFTPTTSRTALCSVSSVSDDAMAANGTRFPGESSSQLATWRAPARALRQAMEGPVHTFNSVFVSSRASVRRVACCELEAELALLCACTAPLTPVLLASQGVGQLTVRGSGFVWRKQGGGRDVTVAKDGAPTRVPGPARRLASPGGRLTGVRDTIGLLPIGWSCPWGPAWRPVASPATNPMGQTGLTRPAAHPQTWPASPGRAYRGAASW